MPYEGFQPVAEQVRPSCQCHCAIAVAIVSQQESARLDGTLTLLPPAVQSSIACGFPSGGGDASGLQVEGVTGV